MPAKVAAIEYDPNRTARIALLHYADGEKRYILAPVGVNVGDTLLSGETVDIRPGNTLPIKSIPLGTVIHNVETQPGSGGKMIRSAGSFGQLMAKEGVYAQIRMPSGEVREVLQDCKATIGQLSQRRELLGPRRQGRQEPLARHPADRARPRHEPGRSPARRRRGQVGAGQPAPGVARGARRRRASRPATTAGPTSSSSSRRRPGVRNTPQ